MKPSTLLAILFALLMMTACAGYSDEDGGDYEDDETQNYATETAESDFEETEFSATESETETTNDPSDTFFGERARVHLEAIAKGIGDREPGSDGEGQAAEYIQGVFEEIGYQPEVSEFSADDEGETISSVNVIATKQGFSEKVIVIGAHYDAAFEDGTLGADDNASGVAVMLEVAEKVFDVETPYTIQFVAFGSEELNLNGSTYFVENMSEEELSNITGMFNLDSLIAGDKMYVYGNEGTGSMRDWVLEDADSLGFEIEGKTDEELFDEDGNPCECADFDAFEKQEIPYAYFEATNWDLSADAMTQVDTDYGSDGEIRHTEYDTVDYIDETFPGRIDEHLNVFVTLLYDLVTQY